MLTTQCKQHKTKTARSQYVKVLCCLLLISILVMIVNTMLYSVDILNSIKQYAAGCVQYDMIANEMLYRVDNI